MSDNVVDSADFSFSLESRLKERANADDLRSEVVALRAHLAVAEQERDDERALAERLEKALEPFNDPLFGVISAHSNLIIRVEIDGKEYLVVPSECFFCHRKATWAKDIEHATDCVIALGRAALAASGAGGEST